MLKKKKNSSNNNNKVQEVVVDKRKRNDENFVLTITRCHTCYTTRKTNGVSFIETFC